MYSWSGLHEFFYIFRDKLLMIINMLELKVLSLQFP